jgi:hypothetical protein
MPDSRNSGHNGSDPEGPTYATKPATGKSPVTIKGDEISLKLPNHNEPDVVFTPTGMTATLKGEFVDHWKKIERRPRAR